VAGYRIRLCMHGGAWYVFIKRFTDL
jgi:hypothetical protein